jgi:hypothetical protein
MNLLSPHLLRRRLNLKETIFGLAGSLIIVRLRQAMTVLTLARNCPILSMVPSAPAHPLVKASRLGRLLAYPV